MMSHGPEGILIFCLDLLPTWQPTPVFLPGEFHGQRSLAGESPWGRKESDLTERLTHTLLSIRRCGNGHVLLGNDSMSSALRVH